MGSSVNDFKIPDIKNLTERKRSELERIVGIIREAAPATEMIILFGSYARGEAVEDITVEGHTTYEYASDFDLLVIVESHPLASKTSLWHSVEDKARKLPVETPVTLIVHDIQFVNARLKRGQYFFSDIKDEGVILYNSGNFELAEAQPLSAEERLFHAKNDFEYWFKRGQEACDHYDYAMTKDQHLKAAFELHQATECFYGAALLVHTNYKPKTHDLNVLRKMAAVHDPAFVSVFPLCTEQEKKTFELLRAAYVGARYHRDYEITKEELFNLAECVKKLQETTKTSCEKKMGSFA